MVTLLFSLSPWSQRKVRRATAERPVTGPWGWQLDQVVGFLQRVVLVYSTSIVKRKSTCLPPRTSQKKKKKKKKTCWRGRSNWKTIYTCRLVSIWFDSTNETTVPLQHRRAIYERVKWTTREHTLRESDRDPLSHLTLELAVDSLVGRPSWPFSFSRSIWAQLALSSHRRTSAKTKKTKQ